MIDAGILPEGEPLELIDGLLVYKDRSAAGDDPMTIGKRHNLVVKLLAQLDPELAARGCHMQTQGPLRLPPFDEPEPDGVVLVGGARAYADRLPTAEDAAAVIEVADASLEHDRTKKLALYASSAIAQYVIVNLREGTVEVYEAPIVAGSRYEERTVLRAGETLALRTAGEPLPIDVARILP